MPIQQPQARSILTPHIPIFSSSIANGWNQYMAGIGDWGPAMTERSRASIVHDLTIRSAIEQFEGVPGVSVQERNRLYLFVIEDQIALRFKKLDDAKRSCNIPTQMALDFRGQQEIPSIPSTLHLEAGYVLNRLQTDIEGIYIVCPSGDNIRWVWELANPGLGNVVQFPVAPSQVQPSVFQLYESGEEEQGGAEE